MGNTVNRIPSANLPLTSENGTIHPIWYEFFRSFISNVVETSSDPAGPGQVVAGDGLTGGGSTGSGVTLDVVAGPGLKANADDIEVDINGQTNSVAALDDEILIVDASDTSAIRKTSLQSVVNLVDAGTSLPGGNDTEIQYNSGGNFGGDSGFTTDGAGSLSVTGDLTVDQLNFNGRTIISNDTNGDITIAPDGTGEVNIEGHTFMGTGNVIYWTSGSTTTYHIGATGGTPYIRGASADYQILVQNNGFEIETGANRFSTFDDTDGFVLSGGMNLQRDTDASITASVTQTQNQQPLTADINEVSTVANTNDVVTLKGALAGRYQLVINNGANTLQIFPATSDDLGAGLNTSTTLAAGSSALFVAYDSTNYVQII